jgi:hypothetical protein
MVNDNTSICNCSVFGDVAYFIMRKEKDGVSGFCDARFPLGEAVELLAHHWHPEIFEFRVDLEYPIYFVMVCLGTGWKTPNQTSLMSMMCPVHCDLVASLVALSCMMW